MKKEILHLSMDHYEVWILLRQEGKKIMKVIKKHLSLFTRFCPKTPKSQLSHMLQPFLLCLEKFVCSFHFILPTSLVPIFLAFFDGQLAVH